jgi:hypothetical protein
MQIRRLVGAILVILGLLILFLLREAILHMIVFVLEFLAVLLGLALVGLGLAWLLGKEWIWSSSRTYGTCGTRFALKARVATSLRPWDARVPVSNYRPLVAVVKVGRA